MLFTNVIYNNKCYLNFRTEEEIGLDNLKNIEVPIEYSEKFYKMDQDFINST